MWNLEPALRLLEQLDQVPPGPEALRAIADGLCLFARSPAWDSSPYRLAAQGEELLHELVVRPGNRPSLYLVSDGPSPPHGHDTWAVIVGVRGHELNHRYALQASLRWE